MSTEKPQPDCRTPRTNAAVRLNEHGQYCVPALLSAELEEQLAALSTVCARLRDDLGKVGIVLLDPNGDDKKALAIIEQALALKPADVADGHRRCAVATGSAILCVESNQGFA